MCWLLSHHFSARLTKMRIKMSSSTLMMHVWFIVLFMNSPTTAAALSYNRLAFSVCATWDPSGIIIAGNDTVGDRPARIFADTNNTLYVTNGNLNQTVVLAEGSSTVSRSISNGLQNPSGLFITRNGDVYIGNDGITPRVEKWVLNGTSSVVIVKFRSKCLSLFIDVNDTLYCSNDQEHKVMKTSLVNGSYAVILAAGNGTSGLASDLLASPNGIFVDPGFNLYVADFSNNRIQLFHPNELNGSTVAGAGAPGTINLLTPSDVVVDANGYLFIVDLGQHRLVASGVTGFRCIVGCSGTFGSTSNQLNFPSSLAFDSHGNLLVNDKGNSRIQKFLLATKSCVPSYNKPKFCSSATWDSDATTFANNSMVGSNPNAVFVTTNNSVYIVESYFNQVQMWKDGILSPNGTITGNISNPHGLFVSNIGDVYIDNGDINGRVERWTVNPTNITMVMNVTGACGGLFIDVNDYLYCSSCSAHQVFKTSLTDGKMRSVVAAGNGTAGSKPYMLNCSTGIFVNINLDLYIADTYNDRIQRFQSNQINGTTMAGNGYIGTITLKKPTAVVLDADGYLFIADSGNNRIVGSSARGFRCIVGCSGLNGLAASQLNAPWSLGFDSYGNLFVTDRGNDRIQIFRIADNLCGPSYNRPKFSACATWDANAITFAGSDGVGNNAKSVYVDMNNTVYVAEKDNSRVQVWMEGDTAPRRNLSNGLKHPMGVFATINGDIYVDNGELKKINKWTSNSTNSSIVATISQSCYGLFIDHDNNLYCSVDSPDHVYKQFLYNVSSAWIPVAGTTKGSSSNQLHSPRGVFVDINFNLYVADSENNRIQRFAAGQSNATTVAGGGVSSPVILNKPSGVVLDADGYLFISDSKNNRIVRSGPQGFYCLFGCTNKHDVSSKILDEPFSLSFDNHGNLYVADMGSKRIQKFLLLTNSCGISYNRPKLCANAAWNANGSTVANSTATGRQPAGLFINTDNTIFAVDVNSSRAVVWSEGNITQTMNISGGLLPPSAVFATMNGDIYVDNSASQRRIDKWTANATNSIAIMYVSATCFGFFVDIDNNVYCSLASLSQVIRKLFNESVNTTRIVAGTGMAGSASDMLSSPRGIFVDISFNLYVADCGNHRVQFFRSGYLNGTTVAANRSNATVTLDCPVALAMDSDGYLFISDQNNHRIVRSGSDGLRCVAGCTGTQGFAAYELNSPLGINFDSNGNLFVIDWSNTRVQLFHFINDSCNEALVHDAETTEDNAGLSSLTSIQPTTTLARTTQAGVSTISSQQGFMSAPFVPSTCPLTFNVGSYCNVSARPCDIYHACFNNATCNNNNATSRGYTCSCLPGFDGSECQYDNRPCQPNTCWNNGVCRNTSNVTFVCQCAPGWEDTHCQTKINYCANVTCLNRGVCQAVLQDYQCQCLGSSSSGRHCETTASKMKTLQTVSKSFAYIAIIAMTLAFLFVIVMDVLKYCFHIDPIGSIRRPKAAAKRKPTSVVRYVYVNAPRTTPLPGRMLSIPEETVV